jgi:hypothetical protein
LYCHDSYYQVPSSVSAKASGADKLARWQNQSPIEALTLGIPGRDREAVAMGLQLGKTKATNRPGALS